MSDTPTIRLSSPGALAASVPYLLGYTPTDSLVLVGMADHKVAITMRADFDNAFEMMTTSVPAISAHNDLDKVILVAYVEAPTPTVIEELLSLTVACPVPVIDTIWVAGERYASVICENLGCCPAEGNLIPHNDQAAVAMIAVGQAPVGSRLELEAELVSKHSPQTLARYAATVEGAMADYQVGDVIRGDHYPLAGYGDAIRFARAVTDIKLRDIAWLALEQLDSERLRNAQATLLFVVRAVPANLLQVPVLFLAGWASWRLGEGTRSTVCLDALDRLDPDYSAAMLLRAALTNGLNPFNSPRMSVDDLDGESI